MDFRKLCQRVGQESGTVGGSGLPTAVTGQSGRLLRIVNWTADAWRLIQIAQPAGWKWQRSTFSKQTTIGNARYTGTNWAITRFRRFMTDDEFNELYPHSIYKLSDGVAAEMDLPQITLEAYIKRYQRGVQTPGAPREYAIDEDGAMLLGPIPDGVYVVNGRFLKSTQILTANGDIPELPGHEPSAETDKHMIIVWRAVMLAGEHDEGAFQVASSKSKFIADYDELVATQLPKVTLRSEPLA